MLSIFGNGRERALQVYHLTMASQKQDIATLTAKLRHTGVSWSANPYLAVATAAGMDAMGMSLRKLDLNSRLHRMLAAA